MNQILESDLLKNCPALQKKIAQAATRMQSSKIVAGGQLPLFPADDFSAIPNHIARSPLFAPIQPGSRVMHDHVLLASPEGVEIRYSGKQLDMSDQDVFLQALRLAQGLDLNQPVRISRSGFLKKLGWKPSNSGFSKDAYAWLDDSFQRLTTSVLHIKTKRYKAHLSLVSEWIQDGETGEWFFLIGGSMRTLFQTNEFGFVDLKKRKQIPRKDGLAKWLQTYSGSHQSGMHHISIENLKKWCKYSSPTRHFINALARSLGELQRLGIISEVTFYRDSTMVKWNRPGTFKSRNSIPATAE